MPAPKLATFPAIRSALKFYQVASIVTGVMLLLLLLEMILKYSPIHVELFAGGSGGLLWFADVIAGPGCEWYSLFVPGGMDCEMISAGDGFNISLFILVAHGWFYVVYLFACFRVWSMMRWPFRRLLFLALGGVIPALSFFLEVRTTREVRAYLARREQAEADRLSADDAPVSASSTEGRA